MNLTQITSEQILSSGEVQFEYFRSSGPGGQNVNKVSTAVRLRFDVLQSQWLPEDVKVRLIRLAGSRVTEQGVLLIEAQRFRTQESNRSDAIERLIQLIVRACQRPRRRLPTRPTAGSEKRRLESKKRRGRIKQDRSRSRDFD
ncbi:MAG: aminoacyl-tRNA hydrolase [Syntrophobacteraceae bacterium]|nr:aminoacyl-tRNA hydrolase [Syntrophobacteraceae bacterium]